MPQVFAIIMYQNKHCKKIYEEMEASRAANNQQRLRIASFEDLDKAYYKWLLNHHHCVSSAPSRLTIRDVKLSRSSAFLTQST